MARKLRISVAVAAVLLAAATAAQADDAPKTDAAPKPVVPSLNDVLGASGITASGYVDTTYAYLHDETSSQDYNTFTLQQAALTLAYQPTTGFGALVNVIGGANPYNGQGYGQYATSSGFASSRLNMYVMQAFAQYVAGAVTLQAGKFGTLAGVEGFALSGNTNVTRSILWGFEPVTHTGVRLTYAPSSQLSLIVGVNNGWTNSQEMADGSDKTLELAVIFNPSKALNTSVQAYYGRDTLAWGSNVKANLLLVDGIVTWNATSSLSLVGSIDYGNVGNSSTTPSASWTGFAGYINYALSDKWRVSLRGEYYDDAQGYLTGNYGYGSTGSGLQTHGEKLEEGTLTFGYDPTKNIEVRIEGRYDFPSKVLGVQTVPKTYQGWLEVNYKFPAS